MITFPNRQHCLNFYFNITDTVLPYQIRRNKQGNLMMVLLSCI